MITGFNTKQTFSGKVEEFTMARLRVLHTIQKVEREIKSLEFRLAEDRIVSPTRAHNMFKQIGAVESVLLSTMTTIQQLDSEAVLTEWIDDTSDFSLVNQERWNLNGDAVWLNQLQLDIQKVEGKLNRKIS
jgi:hypothetical protein